MCIRDSLGLQHLETAAENLRRLGRETIVLSKLDQLRRQVAQVEQRRKSVFGQTAGTTELLAALRQLDQRYVGAGDGVSPNEVAGAVADALQQQLNSLDAQSRQAAALQLSLIHI